MQSVRQCPNMTGKGAGLNRGGSTIEISAYVINAISAVIAVEYIDYGFPKKYSGVRRWASFAVGCAVYFMTVTTLNRVIAFEGVLGFFYAAVLVGYGVWALRGRVQDYLVAGMLWVLIAIIGTYGIFSVMGLLTKNTLGEMLRLQGNGRMYASLVALAVKFSMGKVAAVFFRKREGVYEKENRIVAGAFALMALLAMGLFWLEAGGAGGSLRYVLTIGILLDEAGIIVFLIRLYHRLGRYQKEKMEEEYRREREQERLEGLMDIYRIGREINHWRHDMQRELEVLYRMQKNGKHTEVEACLERLCDGLKGYPELPQPTGNEGLDAALMKMILKCRESGIHFSYVVLEKLEQIDSIALGKLMDNLLCNGMEACQELTGAREMELVVRSQDEGVEISLENSIGESVLKNNPNLISGKGQEERHGFGMESILDVVEKYDGLYECWEEEKEGEKRFCQHIYLSYVQKKG